MATTKISTDTNECQSIKNQIDGHTVQLNNFQDRLNALMSDQTSELTDIQAALNTIEYLNTTLLTLKARQRKLGCLTNGSSELPQDNQTIISASSVRRKDAKALEIPGFSYSQNK